MARPTIRRGMRQGGRAGSTSRSVAEAEAEAEDGDGDGDGEGYGQGPADENRRLQRLAQLDPASRGLINAITVNSTSIIEPLLTAVDRLSGQYGPEAIIELLDPPTRMAIDAVLLAPLSERSRIIVRNIAKWWQTGSIAAVVLFFNQTTSQDLWRELNRVAKASAISRGDGDGGGDGDGDGTRIRARTWAGWKLLLTRAHAEAAGKSQTWQPRQIRHLQEILKQEQEPGIEEEEEEEQTHGSANQPAQEDQGAAAQGGADAHEETPLEVQPETQVRQQASPLPQHQPLVGEAEEARQERAGLDGGGAAAKAREETDGHKVQAKVQAGPRVPQHDADRLSKAGQPALPAHAPPRNHNGHNDQEAPEAPETPTRSGQQHSENPFVSTPEILRWAETPLSAMSRLSRDITYKPSPGLGNHHANMSVQRNHRGDRKRPGPLSSPVLGSFVAAEQKGRAATSLLPARQAHALNANKESQPVSNHTSQAPTAGVAKSSAMHLHLASCTTTNPPVTQTNGLKLAKHPFNLRLKGRPGNDHTNDDDDDDDDDDEGGRGPKTKRAKTIHEDDIFSTNGPARAAAADSLARLAASDIGSTRDSSEGGGNEGEEDTVETSGPLESLLPGRWIQGKVINEALLRLAQLFPNQLYHVDSAIASLATLRAQQPKQRMIAALNGRHRNCAVLLPVNLDAHWALVVIDRHRRQAWIYDSLAPRKAFPARDSAVAEIIRLFIAQYLPFEELGPGPAASCAWDGQGDGGDPGSGYGQQQQQHHHHHHSTAWTVMYAACPQQEDGVECGVYVVACAFHVAQSSAGFEHHDHHPQRRRGHWSPPAAILPLYICADAWRYAIAQVLHHMDGGEAARRLYDFLDARAWAASSSPPDASQSSKLTRDGEGARVLGGDSIEALLSRPGPAGPSLLGQLRSELATAERYRDRVAKAVRHAERWETIASGAMTCLSNVLQEARAATRAEQSASGGTPAGPEAELAVEIHAMEEELETRRQQLAVGRPPVSSSSPSWAPPRRDDEIEQGLSRRARELEVSIKESKAELERLGAVRRAARDNELAVSISGLAEAVSRLSGHSRLAI